MSEPHVVIHTDGACSGNPGPGGWGAILAFGDQEKELKGGEAHTTNNRMELMAAIAALEALKRPCLVDIHTDSQYLRNGILTWINQWKGNGWRTASSACPARCPNRRRSGRPPWQTRRCRRPKSRSCRRRSPSSRRP